MEAKSAKVTVWRQYNKALVQPQQNDPQLQRMSWVRRYKHIPTDVLDVGDLPLDRVRLAVVPGVEACGGRHFVDRACGSASGQASMCVFLEGGVSVGLRVEVETPCLAAPKT